MPDKKSNAYYNYKANSDYMFAFGSYDIDIYKECNQNSSSCSNLGASYKLPEGLK